MVYLLGYPRILSYDIDWLQAFADHYGEVTFVNLNHDKHPKMKDAQLVVLTHSCTAQGVRFPKWVYKARKRCAWLLLSGNDYKDFPDKIEAVKRLDVDVIATLAPNTPYEYPSSGLRATVAHVPHALSTHHFKPGTSYEERPTLIGYRGFRYPDWGRGGRNDVVEAFMGVHGADVKFEVFKRPEVYSRWLQACKATVATEAGAPGMKCISSRQFDAIGSGTALIQTPGHYSGCLGPEHYITLDPDLSNKQEVIDQVRDRAFWTQVTERALDHVLAYHTYAHRMRQLGELLWPPLGKTQWIKPGWPAVSKKAATN